jgi:mono/diheme cytochrome c family protein
MIGRAGWSMAAATAALGMIAMAAPAAHAFPWSTDMYQGPEAQPLEIAPRVMPEGTLPVDGLHYNVHWGQPRGMPDAQAIPPMKLELMTVKMQNPLQPTPENLAHGKALFGTVCAPCHGTFGKGDGTVVHLLQHKPANLMTGVSKNLPDGYIFGYIRNGGIWMPSYDDAMSATERWQVVLYVRDMQKKYGENVASAAGSKTPAGPGAGEPANGGGTPSNTQAGTSEGGGQAAYQTFSSRLPQGTGVNGLKGEPLMYQAGRHESGTAASLGDGQAFVRQPSQAAGGK